MFFEALWKITKREVAYVYKKLVSALYVLNIVAQAIVTLLIPAGLMFLVGLFFVSSCGAPAWLYAVLIPIGVIAGFISMIRFVISASEGVERLEKQGRKNNNEKK